MSDVARVMRGDFETSQRLFAEALETAWRLDDRLALFYLFDAFGCTAAASDQPKIAAQMLGAAETVRTEAGASVNVLLAPLISQAETSARASLGHTSFEAERAAGRDMSREVAVSVALGRKLPTIPRLNGRTIGIHGRREAEVARLVAEGFSNRQIGARLFIAERTVESHVRNILIKLGFNSRAQIASWFASS